ncbi:MAG: hypothetical protein CSA68_05980 [Rhodobacterales bacterium]|nr:MAG: hypothetical protein CSA68_05980 [Rhodobacterales bacterium]
MPKNRLTLRQSRKRPLPRRHAHTASGRDILGLWGWIERGVFVAILIAVAVGVWAYREQSVVNSETLAAYKEQSIVNTETLMAYEAQSKVNTATLREIKEAHDERQAEAINRAWSLITTRTSGNSGKGPALEYLNGLGIPLQGINLSCAHMGGGWDAEKLRCKTPTYLRKVNLQKADLRGAQLQGVDLWKAQLQEADLRDAQLQEAKLWGAHLQRAELWGAHLQGAELWGTQLQGANLPSAQLQGASLWNAQLQGAKLGKAQFGGANLTGTDFTDAKELNTARFHDPVTGLSAWAWADRPPIGLEGVKIVLCVYDYKIHERSTRPSPCIPPKPAP